MAEPDSSPKLIQLASFPVLACTSIDQLNYGHSVEAARHEIQLDWISAPASAKIGAERRIEAVTQAQQWADNPLDAAFKVFEFHNPFRPAKPGVRPVGVVSAAGAVQCAPTDEELRAMGRTRAPVPKIPSLWSQFSGYIFGAVTPKPELAPPQRIPSGLISKLDPLPVSFPVWVKFPEFGTSLATHYMCIESRTAGGGSVPQLFYYVVKLKPYGLVKGEPFAQGIWEVPAPYCMRMQMAVAAVNQEEGLVLVYDDCGRSRTITWAEFRMKPGDDYDKARKALLLQYPDMLLAEFSTLPQLPPAAGPIVESTTLQRTIQPMPADVFVENPTPAAEQAEAEPAPSKPAAAQIKYRR